MIFTFVRNERGTEWIGGEKAHTPEQGLLCRTDPLEGTPAREPEPTDTYRLVFVRWVEKSQEDHWAG
jgi:hypothetical protein